MLNEPRYGPPRSLRTPREEHEFSTRSVRHAADLVTAYPCATSAASTSSRSRKRRVESDVSTSPSEANTTVHRKHTVGPLTWVSSTQLSTAPTPWISVTLYDAARFHSCSAR